MRTWRFRPGRCSSVVLLAAFLLSSQCVAFASTSSSSFRQRGSCWSSSATAIDDDAPHHDAEATSNDRRQQQSTPKEPVDLQSQHPRVSPSQTLRSLAQFCDDNDIETFDVYGDFHLTQDTSYLRQFESEVAACFGKDDAVFMPSGVMAQSIALLIHSKSSRGDGQGDSDESAGEEQSVQSCRYMASRAAKFACHRTSHLLLHEQDGYSDLLGMDAVILPLNTKPCGGTIGGSFGVQPLRLSDVEEAILANVVDVSADEEKTALSTIMIELPHREIGGKLTPWDEVLKMRDLCHTNNVAFHCDGARIFEAAAGYGYVCLCSVTPSLIISLFSFPISSNSPVLSIRYIASPYHKLQHPLTRFIFPITRGLGAYQAPCFSATKHFAQKHGYGYDDSGVTSTLSYHMQFQLGLD